MSMFTKMTANGSSLIVNPRTITKDLETKIAASIARVVARLDPAKLTTRVVRQAVEKDIHVSLTNHKELLKRLMHHELRKLKSAKAAKRVVPEAWKHAARRDSIRKALHRVFAMLRDDLALFARVGLQAMQTLLELQRVETGDVQRLATLYARLLGALWLQRLAPAHGSEWISDKTPAAVVATLQSVFVVEQLGLSHPHRVAFLDVFDQQPPLFTASDYLGWDPAAGPPLTDATGSAAAKLANALLGAFMAQSLGISLGVTVVQLLELLPALYPLRASTDDDTSSVDYADQLVLVSTVVAVVTKFGTLRCEPELLPNEYYWLQHHLVEPLSRQDVRRVSDVLRALKCFENAENLVHVRRGLAFLLVSHHQTPDGAWPMMTSSSTDELYFVTMNAAVALSAPRFAGFAPSLPELAPVLARYVNSDQLGVEAATRPITTTTPLDAGDAHADLETRVLFLQRMLEKDGDASSVKSVSATLATHVVSTLAALPLTVDMLKATGVGRVINKLRKHASQQVATSATALVAKWKKELL